MEMKLLITGFDPFGGEAINPALEAVKLLPDTIHGAQIVKAEIPTVFGKSAAIVAEKIEEIHRREACLLHTTADQSNGRKHEKSRNTCSRF